MESRAVSIRTGVRSSAAQPAADLEPVHLGHQNVEHDRVRRMQREALEGLRPVGRKLDVVTLEPQRALEGGANRRFVVDDQNPHRAKCCR